MSDTNIPAAQPAPSSVSPAKPISNAQLAQELQPRAPESAAPAKAPVPQLPDVPDQRPSPPRPDFKASLKARVLAPDGSPKSEVKPDAVPAPEPKDAPKKIVTFEAKVKTDAPVKKEVVSADDAPPAAKTATTEDAPVPEDQRRVMPHDKPDTARRIKAILAERDAERAAAAAAKKEVEEAKKAGASSVELAALKAEHEKLREDALRLRRLHDIKNDTEFNAKYDEPVKQVDAFIAETLKRNTFGEATLKAIEGEGGFAAFSRSSKLFTVHVADPDDPTKTVPVQKTAAQLSREWLNAINTADAEAIKAGLGKQQLLQSEKAAAIEKEQATAKEYFEKQSKGSIEQQAATKAAQEKTMAEYKAWREKTLAETDFLKDREIPADATPEQKKAIEDHNEFNAQLRARIDKDPTNALEYGALKLEAAESHHLRRTLGEKDARIAELEAQLKQKSAALRTTPKSGSLLKGSGEAPKEEKVNPNDIMGSLRRGLRRAVMTTGEDE